MASIDFPWFIYPNKIFSTVYKGGMILCLKFYKCSANQLLPTNVQIPKFLLLTRVQNIKFAS